MATQIPEPKNSKAKKSITQSRADEGVRPLSAFIRELVQERQAKKSNRKTQ